MIFEKLGLMGYEGGCKVLRDHIRPKRPLRDGRRTLRYETAPGKHSQTDRA
ncbi:MAG: hypothetical protein H5T84_01440 [Thermoleophilia bacterium]|nr:hypothetical protein [Thermoleophilia bacterium]